MLGIGKGMISQAFFIEYYRQALKKMGLEEEDTQKLYDIVFNYFKAIQEAFPDDWNNTNEYNNLGIKSQIKNTNGIGALFRILPIVYNVVMGNDFEFSANNIRHYFERLPNNFWEIERTGTGRQIQDWIAKDICKQMQIEYY